MNVELNEENVFIIDNLCNFVSFNINFLEDIIS